VLFWRPLESGNANNCIDANVTLADRLHVLITLFLITQTRAPNVPLFLSLELQRLCFMHLLAQPAPTAANINSQALPVAFSSLLLSQTAYFAFGGSNSISSIDLSNAYNGVADYNIVAVGVLLFASNWTGAIWWCSAAVTLLLRPQAERLPAKPRGTTSSINRAWVERERAQLHADAVAAITSSEPSKLGSQQDNRIDSWTLYTTAMTAFTAASLVAVMAACTLLRTHLFIWTVFSPKYLYAMAWAVGWHLLVCVGLGRLLWALGRSA
jgi:ethanolaminephosphotransferase